MPPSANHPKDYHIKLKDRILVVIGANGSGKTRFGAWLEDNNKKSCHRVSAHRSLTFPDKVNPTDLNEAELGLYTGHNDPRHLTQEDGFLAFRRDRRWKKNPVTALLEDFHPLVTLLVSESFTVSDRYRQDMLKQSKHVTPPATRLDAVKRIWEEALPARELVISGCRIEARNRTDNAGYHASEMSDGERSIFHLISESLCVPENGLFIVDEPELHLHRAVQARLWEAIEQARPDCTIVYITHDLGFACSRKDATKVWLREYTNGTWNWEEVPDSDELPEPLLLEVIGSRRPILFVEGDRSSLDYFIYGKVFPEYTVVACGSCDLVVHSTCSFTQLQSLHHNKCGGIVDNDGRSGADIQMLNGFGVAVLPVALVENLFLHESIIIIAAKKLGHSPGEALAKVKERVLSILNTNFVRVVSNLTRMEIETGLRAFGKGGDGAEALMAAYKGACAAIDPSTIYGKWEKEIHRVLAEKDYPAALAYYKIKGLPAEAGNVFGVRFQDQVMRWLRSDDSAEIVAALRAAIPAIPAADK